MQTKNRMGASKSKSITVLPGNPIKLAQMTKFTCLAANTTDLTPEEEERFRVCHEAVLNYGVALLGAALALVEMNEGSLYRTRYKTFAAYCKSCKDLCTSSAYYLMAFGRIVEGLMSTNVDKLPVPHYEAQTRPLQKVAAEDRAAVWRLAWQLSGDEEPEMKHVEGAREAFWTANPARRPPPKEEKPEEIHAPLPVTLHLHKVTVKSLRQHAQETGACVDAIVSSLVEKAVSKMRGKPTKNFGAPSPQPDLFDSNGLQGGPA